MASTAPPSAVRRDSKHGANSDAVASAYGGFVRSSSSASVHSTVAPLPPGADVDLAVAASPRRTLEYGHNTQSTSAVGEVVELNGKLVASPRRSSGGASSCGSPRALYSPKSQAHFTTQAFQEEQNRKHGRHNMSLELEAAKEEWRQRTDKDMAKELEKDAVLKRREAARLEREVKAQQATQATTASSGSGVTDTEDASDTEALPADAPEKWPCMEVDRFYLKYPPLDGWPENNRFVFYDSDGEEYPPFDECYQEMAQQGAHAGHGNDLGNYAEVDDGSMAVTKSVVKRTKSANFGEPNWANEEEVMGALMGEGMLLEVAPREFRKMRFMVLASCKNNGMAIKFASIKLRDDDEICMAAVTQNWRAIAYCSKRVRENPELAMAACKQDFNALEHVSQKLKHDRDVFEAGIEKSGLALQYGAGDIPKDRQLVTDAVTQNGLALQYAPAFQNDDDVVALAVAQNPAARKFASDEWKARHIDGWTPKKNELAAARPPPSSGMRSASLDEAASMPASPRCASQRFAGAGIAAPAPDAHPMSPRNSELDPATDARRLERAQARLEAKDAKAAEEKARKKVRSLKASEAIARKVAADKAAAEEAKAEELERKRKYAEELKRQQLAAEGLL